MPSAPTKSQQIIADAAKKCLLECPSDSVTFLQDAFSLLDQARKLDLLALAILFSAPFLQGLSASESLVTNNVSSQTDGSSEGASD